ncbi:MAG: glycoside hydrolase [Ruminococcaceae bacterium]|nr:glycoside hydrolase [Oscillospiraceae bacterium]
MKNGSIHYGDPIKRDGPVETPWQAKWIWGEDNITMHNWLCLRKKVTLSAVPAEAIARIAVDSRYWLWINGEKVIEDGQVKRGPNENDSYFEYVDLTKFLRVGENTIAVLAFYFGNDSKYYSYHSSGQGAFVMEAQLGNVLLVTDESWKVKKHPAFLNRQELKGEGPSTRIPEEHNYYDARLEIGLENWQAPDFDDSSWDKATVYGAVGDAPWGGLWERSIPQMKYWEQCGYQNPWAFAPYQEGTAEEVSIGMRLPYNMQFQPYLKVDAPAGLEIQILSDGDDAINTYYVTKEGVQEFEGWHWMSAQTVTYVIPAGVKILDLQYRQSGYATEFAGSFVCEDEDLNTLWMKSLLTLYITMRDTYMDCPDRERAQWWGDCTNESHMTFYALDPDSYLLYRKGVDTVIGWQRKDVYPAHQTNILQTVVPITNHYFELPFQQLAGVNGFWTYYLYTGEKDLLEQVYQPSMDYLKMWVLGQDGLLAHRLGNWDWPDWGEKFDVPVMENAWYVLALTAVKNMAEVLGITKDLPLINKRIDTISAAFRAKYWTENGYHAPQESYEDNGYAYKFSRPEQPDDRANALAVLAGLADKEQYPAILNVLKNQFNSSPYMEKYVLDAMFAMGEESAALARMRLRYAEMIADEHTTLWEHFHRGWGTKNHAWTGGPLINLSGHVAGVWPEKPGYEQYHVIPQLGDLTEIDVLVPSVKGDIKVQIRRGEKKIRITLDSPENTVARVGVPKLFDGMTVSQNAEYAGEDEKYFYYLAQPGHHEFIGE